MTEYYKLEDFLVVVDFLSFPVATVVYSDSLKGGRK
jgi:hypothetical protein